MSQDKEVKNKIKKTGAEWKKAKWPAKHSAIISYGVMIAVLVGVFSIFK